jgi:hypothetical protein
MRCYINLPASHRLKSDLMDPLSTSNVVCLGARARVPCDEAHRTTRNDVVTQELVSTGSKRAEEVAQAPTRGRWRRRATRDTRRRRTDDLVQTYEKMSSAGIWEPLSSRAGARRVESQAGVVLSLLLMASLMPPVAPTCPVIFAGPDCAVAVAALPSCVNGAFGGSWLTLHKGAHPHSINPLPQTLYPKP